MRLVTQADTAGASTQVDVSLRHELELDGGYRVPLLHDRGWGGSGAWAGWTAGDVRETARLCVGPDEPFGDHTSDTMAADHWAALAATAQQQGVEVGAGELAELPHDVLLSPRLQALLAPGHG